MNEIWLGKLSRGENKKISEYFKGHPPSSPGRGHSGAQSPSPQQQVQPALQPQQNHHNNNHQQQPPSQQQTPQQTANHQQQQSQQQQQQQSPQSFLGVPSPTTQGSASGPFHRISFSVSLLPFHPTALSLVLYTPLPASFHFACQ
jgi:hypothetical protein